MEHTCTLYMSTGRRHTAQLVKLRRVPCLINNELQLRIYHLMTKWTQGTIPVYQRAYDTDRMTSKRKITDFFSKVRVDPHFIFVFVSNQHKSCLSFSTLTMEKKIVELFRCHVMFSTYMYRLGSASSACSRSHVACQRLCLCQQCIDLT